MRFSPNGFYIDSYGKCANCGVLLYDEDHALRHDDRSFCSEWCLTWSKRPADDASPLPLEGAKHTYAGATDVVDLKILDGKFTAVQQAVGTAKANADGAAFLADFVEKAKKSGLVQSFIDRHKVKGLTVAPPA